MGELHALAHEIHEGNKAMTDRMTVDAPQTLDEFRKLLGDFYGVVPPTLRHVKNYKQVAVAAWTTPFNQCMTDEDGTHRYEPDDLALLEDVFLHVNQAHCAKAGIKAIDTKTYIQAALAGKIPEPLTGVRHGRFEGSEGTSSHAPGSSSGNYEGGEAQANVFGGLSTVASGLQAGFYNSGRAIAKQVGLPALQKGIIDQITEDLEALGIQVEGNIEEIAATALQSQLRQGSNNVFQQPSAPLTGYLNESQPAGGLWN